MRTREIPIRLLGTRCARVAIVFVLMLPVCSAFADVTVAQPWVRGTVAPQKATGAFMTIKSTSDAKLVSATSPTAKRVEIHEMVMVNNVMRMRPVAEVALPAGKDVAFKPGGYHIMLMGIERQLKQGDVVPITLTVRESDGKSHNVDVKAEVRDLAASGASKSMSHDT